MGQVFGRNGVAEPPYEVLAHFNNNVADRFPYEIRRYGTRFAAHTSTTYDTTNNNNNNNHNNNDNNNNKEPFMILARYIGVFGTPENVGQVPISMTAPVVMQEITSSSSQQASAAAAAAAPVKIAMTAPVIMTTTSTHTNHSTSTASTTEKTMEFLLPAQYERLDQIPQPTNPRVTLRELPPAMGAVHRFAGSMQLDVAQSKALQLGEHLRTQCNKDLKDSMITPEYVVSHYQYWGYNPPFTLPMFRRNEVWVPLDPHMVAALIDCKGEAEGVSANAALPQN